MIKIIHERNQCIGCNACVAVNSGNWEMNGDGKSDLVKGKFNLKYPTNYPFNYENSGISEISFRITVLSCSMILSSKVAKYKIC